MLLVEVAETLFRTGVIVPNELLERQSDLLSLISQKQRQLCIGLQSVLWVCWLLAQY